MYKAAKVEYVSVRGGRGRKVHATSLAHSALTVCGRKFRRAIVVAAPLNCPDCLHGIFPKTAPRKRRSKPRKRRSKRRAK